MACAEDRGAGRRCQQSTCSLGSVALRTGVPYTPPVAEMKKDISKALILLLALPFILVGCTRPEREPGDDGCVAVVQHGDSIQAALDEASDGAVVCLAAGEWNENLVLTKPITLRGEGPGSTVIRGEQLAQSVVRVTDATGVVVEGLTIAGGARGHLGDEDPAAGILVTGDAEVLIRSCQLKNNTPAGLLVRDAASVTVEDSSLSDNSRYGLVVQGQAEVALRGTTVGGNRDGGVWASGESQVEFRATHIVSNGGAGLWLRDSAKADLYDVTVERSDGPGVRVQDGSQADLEDCLILSNLEQGVLLSGRTRAELRNTVFRGNWDGITASEGATVLVEGCELVGNRWVAVRLTGTSEAVIGNSVLRGSRTGVWLSQMARAQLVANEIREFAGAGISSFGGAAEGEGNRMSGNGVDLLGNVGEGVRTSLREPVLAETEFPHDDHPSLQHAVDALEEGGVLTILAGTQLGSATVDKTLELRGQPGARLEVDREGAPVLSLVGGADVLVSGLELVSSSEVVIAGAVARAEFVDCTIRDGDTGVLLRDGAEIDVRGGEFVGNRSAGMRMWGESHATVEAAAFRENTSFGIGAGQSAVLRASDVTVAGSSWGINLEGLARGTIEDAKVSGAVIGVLIEGGAEGTLTGCEVVDSRVNGVQLRDRAQAVLTGCVVSGSRDDGIVLRSGAQATMEGNRVLQNGRHGVALVELGFSGYVAGRENTIPGPDEPEGNARAAVYPHELAFLLTEDGGHLGWRE